MSSFIYLSCPHCEGQIQVNTTEINCGIFRHGIYKKNWTGLNPHETKSECERLVRTGEVFGCAKPFRLVYENREVRVERCDYI